MQLLVELAEGVADPVNSIKEIIRSKWLPEPKVDYSTDSKQGNFLRFLVVDVDNQESAKEVISTLNTSDLVVSVMPQPDAEI